MTGEGTTTTKTCNVCKQDKPIRQFYRDRTRPDGLLYRCIPCHKEYGKAPHIRAARRAYSKTPHARRMAFIWGLKRNGLTLEQWDAMIVAQDGRCASCSDALLDPHVDHCHRTGRIRGLLCSLCNTAEGLLRGEPARALALAEYMRLHA